MKKVFVFLMASLITMAITLSFTIFPAYAMEEEVQNNTTMEQSYNQE